MLKILKRLPSFVGSDLFFKIIIGLFVFQALWWVFSALYPGAFDEAFHLGIIKIYAQGWSPFLGQQPEGADIYGAIFRDGSYLFHYLMSFPYRFLTLFTSNETAIVIWLRLINVALFTAFLLVSKKVLRRAGLSGAISNLSLLFITLIPIVPQVASQLNYDNLLVLLVAVIVLYIQKSIIKLQAKQLPLQEIAVVVSISLFASVVKYAFLPVFVGVFLFYVGAYFYYRKSIKFAKLTKKTYAQIPKLTKVLLIAGLIMGAGLFIERFGVNTISYGSPVPDCGKVMTYEQCMKYPPWGRDQKYAAKYDKPNPNPVDYMGQWTVGMWYRLFFAINGDVPQDRYVNYPPLPLPSISAVVLLLVSIFAVIRYARELFKKPIVVASATIATTYIGVLWFQNYSMYLKAGLAVAVNGRYLLIVALPLAILFGLALQRLFANRRKSAYLLTAVILLCFLQGGGLINFIVRSKPTWYWPNQTIIDVNQNAQKVLKPFVIGANTERGWFELFYEIKEKEVKNAD